MGDLPRSHRNDEILHAGSNGDRGGLAGGASVGHTALTFFRIALILQASFLYLQGRKVEAALMYIGVLRYCVAACEAPALSRIAPSTPICFPSPPSESVTGEGKERSSYGVRWRALLDRKFILYKGMPRTHILAYRLFAVNVLHMFSSNITLDMTLQESDWKAWTQATFKRSGISEDENLKCPKMKKDHAFMFETGSFTTSDGQVYENGLLVSIGLDESIGDDITTAWKEIGRVIGYEGFTEGEDLKRGSTITLSCHFEQEWCEEGNNVTDLVKEGKAIMLFSDAKQTFGDVYIYKTFTEYRYDYDGGGLWYSRQGGSGKWVHVEA